MTNILFIIATVLLYLASIFFFIDGNSVAGLVDLFFGTVFLFMMIKKLKKKTK